MLFDASRRSASTMSKIELVDTHAHVNFNAYKNDNQSVAIAKKNELERQSDSAR